MGRSIWEGPSSMAWERYALFIAWSWHLVLSLPSSPQPCFTDCIYPLVQPPYHPPAQVPGSVVGSASRFLLRAQNQRDRAKVEWKLIVFQNHCRWVCFYVCWCVYWGSEQMPLLQWRYRCWGKRNQLNSSLRVSCVNVSDSRERDQCGSISWLFALELSLIHISEPTRLSW